MLIQFLRNRGCAGCRGIGVAGIRGIGVTATTQYWEIPSIFLQPHIPDNPGLIGSNFLDIIFFKFKFNTVDFIRKDFVREAVNRPPFTVNRIKSSVIEIS